MLATRQRSKPGTYTVSVFGLQQQYSGNRWLHPIFLIVSREAPLTLDLMYHINIPGLATHSGYATKKKDSIVKACDLVRARPCSPTRATCRRQPAKQWQCSNSPRVPHSMVSIENLTMRVSDRLYIFNCEQYSLHYHGYFIRF